MTYMSSDAVHALPDLGAQGHLLSVTSIHSTVVAVGLL
jgi:hypothetical protein